VCSQDTHQAIQLQQQQQRQSSQYIRQYTIITHIHSELAIPMLTANKASRKQQHHKKWLNKASALNRNFPGISE